VVAPGIMGCGNDNTRVELARARQVSDAGRGYHAGAVDFYADGMQSESDPVGDPAAGITRVLADDDPRLCIRAAQVMAKRASDEKDTLAGKREISRDPANAVSTEELAGRHFGCVLDGEFSGSIVTVTCTERGLETWMRGSEM